MRLRIMPVLSLLTALLMAFGQPVFAGPVPIPADLAAKGLKAGAAPTAMADAFVGIPYRNDGTLDEAGRYVLFERPDRTFPTPGLNCSGLVLSLSRFVLSRDITLSAAKRDRLGDSGEDSPLGKDWDFGFDLIFNIAETAGTPRLLVPEGVAATGRDGRSLRGFPLSDLTAWAKILPRMRAGTVVLGSVSKSAKDGIRHHHVVLILPVSSGRVLLYHATPKTGVHRLEISQAGGLAAFIDEMERGGSKKMILLVEAPLP